MTKKRKINDPVFGFIELDEDESTIVDTPLLQRLRYIKQLSLAHYVYPSATHDRFSHSLGVFYITNEIINILSTFNKDLFDDYARDLKMAALLHDIGHFPFSHSLEYSKKDNPKEDLPFFFKISHEEFGEYIIKNSYLKQDLVDFGYNPELICDLITGNDLPDRILNKIINWELDADRLDYILRDSFFTGVGFGKVNYKYLINNFKCQENIRIIINSKAIRDIEHFIIARFSLYDRVYTHKRISFFDFFLTNTAHYLITNHDYPSFRDEAAIKEILKDKDNSTKLYELTDFNLLNNLKTLYHDLISSGGSSDKNLIRWLEIILFRKKYFKIKEMRSPISKSEADIDLLKAKCLKLIEQIQIKFPDEIYLDAPKNKFTKYIKTQIPPSGLNDEVKEKLREEEEHTIWIQHKNDKPEMFYRSTYTFFEKIYEFGITKLLFYLNEENSELKEEFEKMEPEFRKKIAEF